MPIIPNWKYLILPAIVMGIALLTTGFNSDAIQVLAGIEVLIGIISGIVGVIMIIISNDEEFQKKNGALAFSGAVSAMLCLSIASGEQDTTVWAFIQMVVGGVVNINGILYRWYKGYWDSFE